MKKRIKFQASIILMIFIALAGYSISHGQVTPGEANANVRKITKNDNGVMRGIELGMPFEKVKAIEGPPYSEDTSSLTYSFDFNDTEWGDVTYNFTSRILSGIDIDLFLDEHSSISIYVEAFKNYFNSRFGPMDKSFVDDMNWPEMVWYWDYKGKKYQISIINLSSEDDAGIWIEITESFE